ncbi:hypothetical protein [Chryseobacterium balustinum]|uniref:hypothetical protein n=1 Tax=Chryseobacterium balustinum TaxID=246 RepID=UPI003CEEC792
MIDERGVSMRVDVWLISLYLTILGVAVGAWMKAYYLTFFLAIYSSLYSLTVYILMMKGVELDADWVHRVGFLLLLAPGIYIVYRLNSHIKDLILKDEIQSKTIDRIIEQNSNNDEN